MTTTAAISNYQLLNELANSKHTVLSTDFIFYQYYMPVKYLVGYKLYEFTKEHSLVDGNKAKNLKMDIFLDGNVPDYKSYYETLVNNDQTKSIKLETKRFNQSKVNFFIPTKKGNLITIKKVSDNEFNVGINIIKIVDMFYEANFKVLYDNVPAAKHIMGIFDKIFELVKDYIKNLISDKLDIK